MKRITKITKIIKGKFSWHEYSKYIHASVLYISLSSYSPAIVMYRTHGRAWYPLFSMILRYRTCEPMFNGHISQRAIRLNFTHYKVSIPQLDNQALNASIKETVHEISVISLNYQHFTIFSIWHSIHWTQKLTTYIWFKAGLFHYTH